MAAIEFNIEEIWPEGCVPNHENVRNLSDCVNRNVDETGYDRRQVVRVGDRFAVVLSDAEARALHADDNGEVEVFSTQGVVELRMVNRYAQMSSPELWAIIEKTRVRS